VYSEVLTSTVALSFLHFARPHLLKGHLKLPIQNFMKICLAGDGKLL